MRQVRLEIGHRDYGWRAPSEGFTQDTHRQCIANAKRPFIDRVKRRRCHDDGIGLGQGIGLPRQLLLAALRITYQSCERRDVNEVCRLRVAITQTSQPALLSLC